MVSANDQYGVDDDLADTLQPIDPTMRESSIPPTVISHEEGDNLRTGIGMGMGAMATDFTDGLSEEQFENEPFFGPMGDCQQFPDFLMNNEHPISEPTSPTNPLFGLDELDLGSPVRSPMMNRNNTDDSRLNPPLRHGVLTMTEIEQSVSKQQNVNTDRRKYLRSTTAQSHGPKAISRVEELRRVNAQSHRIPRTTTNTHGLPYSPGNNHYEASLQQPSSRSRHQSPSRTAPQPRSHAPVSRLSGYEHNYPQNFGLSSPPRHEMVSHITPLYQQQGMVPSGYPLASMPAGNLPMYYNNRQHGNIGGRLIHDNVLPPHDTHTSFTPDRHQRESLYSTINVHDDESGDGLISDNWQESLSGRDANNSRGGYAYNMEHVDNRLAVMKRESSLDASSQVSRDVSVVQVQRAGVTPRDISADDSFPRTENAKQKYLKRMIQAMHSMQRATDNDGIVRNWRNALSNAGRREEIEEHCGILMGEMLRKHQQIEPLAKNGKARHYDRFEELVEEMVQNLQDHKTMCKHVLQAPYKWVLVDDPQAQAHRIGNNREVNKKKKIAIEAGRAAMGLEGQGKGKKPVKVERVRAGSLNDDEEDAEFEIDPEYQFTDSTPNGTTYSTPPGNNAGNLIQSSPLKRARRTHNEDADDEEFKPDRSRKRIKGGSRSKYQLGESGEMIDTSPQPEENILGSSPGPQQSARRTHGHVSTARGRTSHQLSEQNNYTENAHDTYQDDQFRGRTHHFSRQSGQRRH